MSDGSHAPAQVDVSWLQLITDALPGILWSTDTALRIKTCQGTDLPRISRRSDELCGTSLFELFETEDINFPPIAAHRQSLRGAQCPIVFTLGGQNYRGVVSPVKTPVLTDGSIVGCVTVAFDLTSLEARCQSIADTAVDLILFLRPDGFIEQVNRTATGSPKERVIGKTIFDFTPRSEHGRLRGAMEQAMRTGKPVTLEIHFPRRFDSPAWHIMRFGPVRTMGEIAGLVLLATDITQHKQALAKVEAEEGLLRDLLELQDRERRLVAYEIHDGFIQDVVGSRMIMQGIRDALTSINPHIQKRLDTAVTLMARAINEGRRLISELRPMIIDEMGLVDAVDYLVGEEEARGDIDFTFTHRMQLERLPPLLQATIFRIIREAVTNARRHGQATRVDIRLTQIGTQHLIIEIQDNGCGFDPSHVPPDRYGLSGIRERARLFGGGASIESSPGQGTRITVKVALDTPSNVSDSHSPDWKWTV